MTKAASFTMALAVSAAASLVAPAALADDKADCFAASEKAQQLRDDHKLLKGREQFLACARDVCPAAVKKDCADQVAEIDKRTPTVVVRAKDKAGQDLVAVKVTSDGEPLTEQLDGHAVPLDPGVHTFRFEAAGNEPFEQKVVLGEGEHNRPITANFGKGGADVGAGGGSGKKGAPIGAFVVGGIGLVAMGVAPIFYAMGLSERSSILNGTQICTTSTCTSEKNDISSKLVVGDIFMFGGAAVLAAGIIWTIVHYTTGSKEASTPPVASFDVSPTVFGRGAVASTTIRW